VEAGGSALVEEFDWNNSDDIDFCPVQAVIEAKDSVGLLAAVSSCITELGKPIVKSASSSYATGYATLAYEFLVEDIDALTLVLESLRGMEGIDSVRRKGDPTTPSVDQALDVDDKAKALLDDESIWTEEL